MRTSDSTYPGLQLVNKPHPLHPRVVDDLPLSDFPFSGIGPRSEGNVTVNRIVAEVLAEVVFHLCDYGTGSLGGGGRGEGESMTRLSIAVSTIGEKIPQSFSIWLTIEVRYSSRWFQKSTLSGFWYWYAAQTPEYRSPSR